MIKTDVDILIAGGGIAGLIATLAFARAGHSVVCVEPKMPITTPNAGADYRATALLQPSIDLLDTIGVWDFLADYACALHTMRIIDIGGADYTIRYDARFNGAEIGVADFGQNILNWRLKAQLLRAIKAQPNAEFLGNIALLRSHAQSEYCDVELTDRKLRVKLLIAADGRDSPSRAAAGIAVSTRRYNQRALSFVIAHQHPHENSSVELHRNGGPCTFVPLSNQGAKHISAVVWMCDAPDAARIAALPESQFLAALEQRSAGIFGVQSLQSPIDQWPIISQQAQCLSRTRFALLAEAAHVVPPIGAQGLNMSIADIAALRESLSQHPVGSAAQLAVYVKARKRDIAQRIAGIDLLNRAAQTNIKLFKDLRMHGLRGLHQITPLRQIVMRMGLGIA